MSISEISSGLDSVLARIAQIQAQFAPAVARASTATAGVAGSGADFASTLASANSGSGSALGGALLQSSGLAGSGVAGLTAGTVTGSQIVDSAKKYLGVPYVFGGTTATGIDCSGLVQRAYSDLGVSLPRLSWDQAKAGTPVANLAAAQPGDILGFGNPAEHVAIYLGDNQMIAAPQPGENVKIQSVYETPASIRRIVGTDTGLAGYLPASSVSAGSAIGGTMATTGSVSRFDSIFKQVESQYNLPAGLLSAVAQTESGGNTAAVSPAGAQGLMQLMPTTAAGLAVNPWDPTQSVQGAGKLLSSYLTKYSSVPLALAAYNAGPGAVDTYGGVPPFAETQNYVSKITSMLAGA